MEVLQDVQRRKEGREAVLAERQRYLDDIQAHLNAMREAAEPLSKHLQLPPRGTTQQQQLHAAISLLPLPLFIIYRQLMAVAEVFGDPVEVAITGET